MGLNDLVPFKNRRRGATGSAALSPFEQMHHEMDRLFEDFLPQFSTMRDMDKRFDFLASVDLGETDDALELKADLPGMEEGDIDLTLQDGALIISGERKHETEEKKKNYYRAERAYGAFNRAIPLPCEVDEDHIEARFKKGVLSVHMPKSPDAKQNQRKIPINDR